MTTDEETRLQNDLIQAIFEEDAAKVSGDDDWWSSALDKRRQAFDALRDYRTKSPSPPTLRVEPPEEHRHLKWHWLSDGCDVSPYEFNNGSWVLLPGEACGSFTPQHVAKDGYTYIAPCNEPHSPCTPPSRMEVNEEATDGPEWSGGVERLGTDLIDLGRLLYDGLRVHFFPTQPAPFSRPTDPSPDHFAAWTDETAQPAPVQQEITDEEIGAQLLADLGGTFDTSQLAIIHMSVITLLSKHSPTITPTQWETIRKLAITEAPQVFAQEARDVLRGGR